MQDPVRVTRVQMWTAGADQNKIEHQPNSMLSELWHQLKLEQQFRRGQKRHTERARMVALKDFLKPYMIREKAEVPIWKG